MSVILVKFGQNVRRERKKCGLSQGKLAELAGMHRTCIGMIERAEKNITLENIEKVAKALGLPPHILLCVQVQALGVPCGHERASHQRPWISVPGLTEHNKRGRDLLHQNAHVIIPTG